MLPESLSVKEQIFYILVCLTRAKADEQTDMYKIISAFIDQSLAESTNLIIFTNNGYREQENLTEQCQKVPMYEYLNASM